MFKKTSSKVGIDTLYDLIFKFPKPSSNFAKKSCKFIFFINLFSILFSSLIGILNIISSDKISYSTFSAKVEI